MKPIIFARIADMKFYKGITDTDKPVNGGSYVKDTNYAHECYNFDPVIIEDEKEYCLGFTQLLGGKDPQLHIEHIVGCKGMKDALSVDNSTEEWLDTIEDKLEYEEWYLGHWHTDNRIDKMHFLFHGVEVL